MSQFEYITVAYSIVIALSIARCLDALPAAIEAPRRYWVHIAWVFIKLSNPILLWWAVWQLRAADWTYARFVWLLLPAVLIYLQVIYLVTTEPHAVKNWRSHFFAKRRQFFALNVLLTVLLIIGTQLYSAGLSPLVLVGQAGILGGSIAAGISDSDRLHAVFVLCVAATNLVGFSLAFGS